MSSILAIAACLQYLQHQNISMEEKGESSRNTAIRRRGSKDDVSLRTQNRPPHPILRYSLHSEPDEFEGDLLHRGMCMRRVNHSRETRSGNGDSDENHDDTKAIIGNQTLRPESPVNDEYGDDEKIQDEEFICNMMPFACDYCGARYRSEVLLIRHQIDNAHYYCSVCDRLYRRWQALLQHFHDSSSHNFCSDCEEDFPSEADLETHLGAYCPYNREPSFWVRHGTTLAAIFKTLVAIFVLLSGLFIIWYFCVMVRCL